MSHHSCTFLFLSDVTCMIVHPLMEFELCFACVLLMTFFAIDEIADIFGFVGFGMFQVYSTSCHPKHTKTSLPYCLALRLRRICSTDTLFQQRTHEMKHHLLQRGYRKAVYKMQSTRPHQSQEKKPSQTKEAKKS